VDKRVFGLSNSYRVVSAAGKWQLPLEEAERRLFGAVAPGELPPTGVVLSNGGRLRLDAAGRPEYATPECGSAHDLVVQDKACEQILEAMLAAADPRLGGESDADGASVLKVSADPAGSSYGCQEAYPLAGRGESSVQPFGTLFPFLVTRQLICGAGAVLRTPRGAAYCLSRPTGYYAARMSSTGPQTLPLTLTIRDESRPPGLRRRLLVTASDPSMSETTTLLKAGATDLVVRMAEAGALPPALSLASFASQVIDEVSGDITGRALLPLAGGRRASVLDIQREYLARATDFAGEHGADTDSARVLELWRRALDAIETGNLDAIAREIDWVIKYQLIERYRAAHDLPLSAPQVAQADLAYHDINRSRGLYYQLQRDGAVERTARDTDILEAKTHPPHGSDQPMGSNSRLTARRAWVLPGIQTTSAPGCHPGHAGDRRVQPQAGPAPCHPRRKQALTPRREAAAKSVASRLVFRPLCPSLLSLASRPSLSSLSGRPSTIVLSSPRSRPVGQQGERGRLQRPFSVVPAGRGSCDAERAPVMLACRDELERACSVAGCGA
jgi:proteasome accessory factor A